MKKTIFLMAVAALAMTSCAKEETLESNPGEAIDFRVAMGTRAGEEANTVFYGTDASNLLEFYVTAIKKTTSTGTTQSVYFDNVKFTRTEAGENTYTYNSDPNYYWPADGSELTFYAYAPERTKLDATNNNTMITEASQTLKMASKPTIGQQYDFIVAEAKGSKTEHPNALVFKHTLAQIGVQAKVDENTTLTYTISGVKIVGFKGAGTFTFPAIAAAFTGSSDMVLDNSVWSSLLPNEGFTTYKTPDSYVAKTVQQKAIGTEGEDPITNLLDANALVIPQAVTAWNKTGAANGAYIAVKIKAVQNDASKTVVIPEDTWAAAPIPATTFEPGKKYIYTLDFSKGAGWKEPGGNEPTTDDGQPVLDDTSLINFVSVSVSDWTNVAGTPGQHEDEPVEMK